jgi:EpsI family protein
VTIALFCLIIILNVAVRPLEATSKGKIEPGEIPKAFGAWTSRDVPIDEMSRKELKTADLLQRVYTNTQDGRQVMLFVEAARDTDAFHDPHSCLPGGGSPITQDQLVDLRLAGPKPLTVKATALQAATDYGQHLVLYWYMSGREACSSTSEVRRTMRVIQLRDLYRLATNPGRRERLRADIGKRQWHWYRFSIDVWQDPDTDLTLLKQFARDLTANSKHFGQ